jgi:tetratricopeptide (TPR) repeat protein
VGVWIFLKGPQRRGTSSQHVPANDPKAILAEANHFAFLSNSYRAEPLYAKAEEMFRERGDKRDELYAKIGRLRAEAETMSFVKLSDFLESKLTTPLVQNDPKLKLWCLSAKGMTDIEVNVPAAKKDWQEAELLASTLKERQWEARAQGELGLIAFLQGKSLKAGQLVGGALLSAIKSGDVGAEIRYLELVGNGLEVQGRSEDAQYFFDRAINVAKSCKDCGFPYMAYEGKGEALTALDRTEEARAVLIECLNEAKRERRTGHTAQTLILLGKRSLKTGNAAEAIKEMETAAIIAGKYKYYRMDADDLFDLANIYEHRGELAKAEKRLVAARGASMRLGDRYSLPRDLTALARLEVRLGKIQEAERLYDEAEDVVDSVVLNAPGPYSGGSFVGEASETYLGDFELAAKTDNVDRAFRALERARGRTIALPPYREEVVAVEMDPALKEAYEDLEKDVKQAFRDHRGNQSVLSTGINALLLYPDRPFELGPLCGWEYNPETERRERFVFAEPRDLDRNTVYAKERQLVDEIKSELERGRKVQVYAVYTQKRDVTRRLESILAQEGIRVTRLTADVKPELREAWYERQLRQGTQVVIAHPRLVALGLDLLSFPTLIFYETGYSIFTLRQASRRSWRIGQYRNVVVKYFAYKDTAQETCLRLMGRKLLVSLAMEGKFSAEGLQAVGDEDILIAMARELVTEKGVGESASALWRKLQKRHEESFGTRQEGEPGVASRAESVTPSGPLPLVSQPLYAFGMPVAELVKRKSPRRVSTSESQLALFDS